MKVPFINGCLGSQDILLELFLGGSDPNPLLTQDTVKDAPVDASCVNFGPWVVGMQCARRVDSQTSPLRHLT